MPPLQSGDLVGLQEGGVPSLGIVEAIHGNRVRLRLGTQGKPHAAPQRQLELLASLPSAAPIPQRLSDPPWGLDDASLKAARPSRRNWGAAWLLLRDSGETHDLAQFADLVCGSDGPAERAACWLELQGRQLWFRWRHGRVESRGVAELTPLRRQRRLEALQQALEHDWRNLLRQRLPLKAQELPAAHQQRLEQLQQLAEGRLEADQLEPGLVRSLMDQRLGLGRGEVRHLLADLGLWDRHRLVSITDSPWSSGFSPEQQQEAERLMALCDQPMEGDDRRLDLSHQHVVTIDDEDTLDLDDALALEHCADGRQRLWIHVADPGRLIEAGSLLDLEARRRGSSLYLAQGSLPMFPECLATGPMSLRAGVRCAAWSTWVELDGKGAVTGSGMHRSWICPAYRLSYADADALIDLAPPEEPDLALMAVLLEQRRRWRQRQGALQMDLPEGRIRCRNGEAVLEITEPSPSRQLVAEAMILAGAVAAAIGIDQGLALPYRSQLPAELPSAAELAALPDGAVRFAALKRCLSRGLVGTTAAPHFSLGLMAYVQTTSPIRRYGDLLVQRQIAAAAIGGPVLDDAALQPLLDRLDGAVREGIGISREDQRHWQQVWFEDHRSQQWRAEFLRWLRPQDGLGLVRIDELALELPAECPQGAMPGQGLLVRVQQVDCLRDQLRLVAAAS